jgi:hypothetical protein
MKKTWLFAILALLAAGLACGASITVTQPDGRDVRMGSVCPIAWTAVDVASNVKIRLIRPGGALVQVLENNWSGGSPYNRWTVAAPAEVGGTYKIHVKATDNSAEGVSETFTVVAADGPPTGGSIIVTMPNAATSWMPGSRQTITWTNSGTLNSMANITLRREGAPEEEDPAARICDGCANNESWVWFIPDHLNGRYFVRVKEGIAGGVKGDSSVFSINASGDRSGVPGPDTPIRAELEMPGIGVEHYNGHIVAWVKNNGPDSVRNHDVKFHLNFPEEGRGAQIITKRITVPVGAEEGVELLEMTKEEIPDTGLRTLVRIDTNGSHIQDRNPYNNHRDVRLCVLDIHLWMPSNEFKVVRKYTLPGKYVVRFHIHVSHNLGRELRNVRVGWGLQGPDGVTLIPGERTFTIDSLPAGPGVNRVIEQDYSTPGGFPPALIDGTRYRMVARIIDEGDLFYDVNPRNDSDTRSFTTPD